MRSRVNALPLAQKYDTHYSAKRSVFRTTIPHRTARNTFLTSAHPKMLRQVIFLLTPLAGVSVLSRLEHKVIQDVLSSPTRTYCCILGLQIFSLMLWRVFIKPLYFSRYRDIPEPPVSTLEYTDRGIWDQSVTCQHMDSEVHVRWEKQEKAVEIAWEKRTILPLPRRCPCS